MPPIDYQADTVVQKIRHYLISTMGCTIEEATDDQFYRAFCWAFREEIMINWTATTHTMKKPDIRKVYYISLEYMPGRQLSNNVTNIGATELVKTVLKKMGRNFSKILYLEHDIGIGNGGLGRLASCFMDSLATQNYPAMGYGMRYQYGIFEQELWFGVQVERPDRWLLTENPWEFRRDNRAVNVLFGGKPVSSLNTHFEEQLELLDPEEVRALPYDLPIIGYNPTPDFGVLTLRLWSTKESPRNFQLQRFNAGKLDQAAENISLTDVLYPNDNHEAGKRIRLKQEFLLVSASLQDIINQHLEVHPNLDNFADKVRIQINDTHPALMVAELMLVLTQNGRTWKQAFDITQEVLSYTNHTILKEALEEWNINRVQDLLPRQQFIIEKLNQDLCNQVRQKYQGDEEKLKQLSIIERGQVRMANLAIFGSHTINGVAALHTEILKKHVFKDFYDLFPEKFQNVTNGVTQRRWLLDSNPKLADFITKRIGDGWIMDFKQISKLSDFAKDEESLKELMAIKKENKQRALDFLTAWMMHYHWGEQDLSCDCMLGPDALFDVHIKRIHEYKRQLMKALHTLMLYFDIKRHPEKKRVPRMVLFGGKAAPGYEIAKNIIRCIYCIGRKINADPDVHELLKVFYVENYNVSKAEILIPATDLSEQISTAGMEASGTGNMKFAINGALTIGTDDGANVEMRQHITDAWWPFLFGQSANENLEMHTKDLYDPHTIMKNDPDIAEAVECLNNKSLIENEAEHIALSSLYDLLLKGTRPDHYFILNDLRSFYETQEKVDLLYSDPMKWAEYALHNIAGMGAFTSDESIHNYAKNIWDIKPCPPSKEELEHVRKEYGEHDRCRIIAS